MSIASTLDSFLYALFRSFGKATAFTSYEKKNQVSKIGKGTSLLVLLDHRKCVRALAPEVLFLPTRDFVQQPVSAEPLRRSKDTGFSP